MKTLVLGTIASLTLSVALVAAQQQTPPPTQQTPPPTQQQTPPPTPPTVPTQPPQTPTQPASQKLTDVELTGCLVQGSGPTVFVIENAKTEAQTEAEKGKSFVLLSGAEKIEFTPHLNKKVKISGSVDNTSVKAMPPAGQRIEEKDLPRLTVKSVVHVADTCALMVN